MHKNIIVMMRRIMHIIVVINIMLMMHIDAYYDGYDAYYVCILL